MLRALAALALLSQTGQQPPAREVKSPLSPKDALAEFRLDPGLRVELVASEPEIESPVDLAFDESGRLYVVEMRDYPSGPPPGHPPTSRVKLLEDRDGDGRFETSTLFADQLLFANSAMPWRGGVIVTAAPHILWLKDSDGDGKADVRETLFEGFAAQNPQLRVNHPTLGIDNWIYVANGTRGGQIRPGGRADAKPIDIGGMDFRFDLIQARHEATTGMGQYGLTFDDWGRRFVCTNRNHVIPLVLHGRYLARNPFLAPPGRVTDNQAAGGAARIYPLSRNWTTSNLHAATFTAACGVHVYRGDLLPESYRGSVFTCDPTGNLVHQELLTPEGAGFRHRMAREGVEFLASPDDWFRPVSLAAGPDGAMYVADMYRAVIEHPEFVPADLRDRLDFASGKDRGRIWRIVPEGHRARPPRPDLGRASTEDLVNLLAHPGVWWRTTAQRLLLERRDAAAWEPLRRLIAATDRPVAKVHAAWLLEGLRSLDIDVLLRLLSDPDPRVRENAVLLAERRILETTLLPERLKHLADDPDPRVRFQVALTLGEWENDAAIESLAKIALRGAGDRWTRLAVQTAVPHRAAPLISRLLRSEDVAKDADADLLALLRELAALVGGRRDPPGTAAVLDALLAFEGPGGEAVRLAGLLGLAEGVGRRGGQLSDLLKAVPDPGEVRGKRVQSLLAGAGARAIDSGRPTAERLDAVRLLAHARWESAEPALTKLMTDDPLPEIRGAAVGSLSAHPRPEVAAVLVENWKRVTPSVKREMLDALLRRVDRVQVLLREVEEGRILPGELGAAVAQRLTGHANAEVRDRAKKVLRTELPEDRRKVMEAYRSALAAAADARRGREVFQKNCAPCHRVNGIGVNVGPDISDTRTKTPDQLLRDILDPSAAIDNNYVNFIVRTKSESLITGFIAEETAASIRLRRQEGQEDVVLRQDIADMRSSGVSLMPEGLEKAISIEQMGDLIKFLKDWRLIEGGPPLRPAERDR